MKKKGLIISTVVMVVVLIASLTTATYAWFTQDTKTSISGFELQVVAGNAVNIGVKKDLTAQYSAADTSTAFVSGTCSYTGTKGKLLGVGSWDGDPGLGPTLEHQIMFGEMSKAVGFTNVGTATDANINNTTAFSSTASKVIAANKGKADGALSGQVDAVVNGNVGESTVGDLAYLWLGVSPAQELQSAAKLHIFVQSNGGGENLGIAAAVHVAYSVNGTTWVDVDAFNNLSETNTNNTITYATTKASYTTTMPVDATDVFTGATKSSVQQGMTKVTIDLTQTEVGKLDQVQLVIYLAGSDSDCVDAAKGVSAKVGMFFEAVEKETEKTAAPTAATIGADGKLTMTGIGTGTIVEYSVDNGTTWIAVAGTWTNTTFTSTGALTEAQGKGTSVVVRQKAQGKGNSEEFTVTANSYDA